MAFTKQGDVVHSWVRVHPGQTNVLLAVSMSQREQVEQTRDLHGINSTGFFISEWQEVHVRSARMASLITWDRLNDGS